MYKSILGLVQLGTATGRITLGTGSTPLLELVGDPGLTPNDGRQAGLFHTAFLMPSRPDLARWLAHAVAARVPLQGASDHIVSEAIYLADPEGNGIEIYVDRPVARWHDQTGAIRMSTDPLDAQDLLGAAEGTQWRGFPVGGMIGHVHLQVGDTAAAATGLQVAGVIALSGRLAGPVATRSDWPPITLLHGSADPVIAPEFARSTEAWLRSAGAEPQLQMFDGLGHVIDDRVLAAIRILS